MSNVMTCSPAILLFLLISASSPRSVEPFANTRKQCIVRSEISRLGALPERSDDDANQSVGRLSRRGALQQSIFFFAVSSLLPRNARATTIPSRAVDAFHPPIQFLEPFYELRLSMFALADVDSADPKKWPRMLKRLDQFFSIPSGQSMSERDVYVDIGREYADMIRYSEGTAGEVARSDREARSRALDDTFGSLESLRVTLEKALVTKSGGAIDINAAEDVERYAQAARRSLFDWFDMIPADDVRAVDKLVQDVNDADTDRDGRLSKSEMAKLPASEREVWERRVERYGRTKVEKALGFKIGHKNFV